MAEVNFPTTQAVAKAEKVYASASHTAVLTPKELSEAKNTFRASASAFNAAIAEMGARLSEIDAELVQVNHDLAYRGGSMDKLREDMRVAEAQVATMRVQLKEAKRSGKNIPLCDKQLQEATDNMYNVQNRLQTKEHNLRARQQNLESEKSKLEKAIPLFAKEAVLNQAKALALETKASSLTQRAISLLPDCVW